MLVINCYVLLEEVREFTLKSSIRKIKHLFFDLQNIAAVCFHPELPVILTGSEDGTVRVWHANTYRLENTLNYGLERVWTIASLKVR